jgi:SET domain
LQAALDLCVALSIKPDDWLLIGTVFLKLSLVIKFNCFAIECFKANFNAEADSLPILKLGPSLFLASSLMNHSCDANLYNVFYGTSVVFRARRPIVKGEEITFCYMKPATLYCYEERQKALLENYKFKCRYETPKPRSCKKNYTKIYTKFSVARLVSAPLLH